MTDSRQQIARFERYVELDPHNATLWVGFGDVLHRAGLFDRAEQAFHRARQLEPASAIAPARLAAVEMSRGNFASAEHMLNELVEAGEQDPAVRFNLALSLYYQRRFAQALEILAALAPSPSVADARYYLLSCLHNLSRLDEAMQLAEQFLGQRYDAKLSGYLALIQMDAGRMSEALQNARRVLLEQPDNPDAAAVLSTHCLETQQMDEGQRNLNLLVAREPRNVRAWQGLALVALHRQQHEEAVRLLERARECDEHNTGTVSTLGWVRIAQHQYAAAERVLREGIEIDRNDAELHGGLATALVFQRRFDEARQEISRAFRLDRRCFGAAFAQSIMLKLEGRDEAATRLFANVLQSSPRGGGQTLLDGLITYWKSQGSTSKPPSTGGQP